MALPAEEIRPGSHAHRSLPATLYCRRCRLILEDAIRRADWRNTQPPDPAWPRPHLLKAMAQVAPVRA